MARDFSQSKTVQRHFFVPLGCVYVLIFTQNSDSYWRQTYLSAEEAVKYDRSAVGNLHSFQRVSYCRPQIVLKR